MAGATQDTSELGLREQFGTLGRVYWIANVMEMLERLAYYGLRVVVPVYMLLAVEAGGPELDNVQKGQIFAIWAAVQSFVPVFSGGFADRFGYKRTVGVSIGVKIAGYLLMAWAVDLAAWWTAGASVGVRGHSAVYWTFLAGAVLLALGTAVFKPGLQGIISTEIDARNGALAWGLFYQIVNVGGFLGPFLAGAMRLLSWRYVFISCAVIVALNYVLLLTFDEPEKEADPRPTRGVLRVLYDSGQGVLKPRLFAFLAIFSGFWAMFYQLFDLLPNYIDDWIDSRAIVDVFVGPVLRAVGGSVPDAWGGNLPQEYMINLNALLISIFAFAVGYATGRLRSMTAMVVGILVSAAGILALGAATSGWIILLAIATFSVGEMLASPTKLRYLNHIAPPGQKALYLGYANATTGIGWSLGSLVAGELYEAGGDRTVLARRHLVQVLGMPDATVEALAKTDVMPTLAAQLGTDFWGAQEVLWQVYEPWRIWTWFATIGVVSMLGLIAFDRISSRAARWEAPALAAVTWIVCTICYDPFWGGVMGAAVLLGWLLHPKGA